MAARMLALILPSLALACSAPTTETIPHSKGEHLCADGSDCAFAGDLTLREWGKFLGEARVKGYLTKMDDSEKVLSLHHFFARLVYEVSFHVPGEFSEFQRWLLYGETDLVLFDETLLLRDLQEKAATDTTLCRLLMQIKAEMPEL